MSSYYILGYLPWLIGPVIIIGLIIWGISRIRRKSAARVAGDESILTKNMDIQFSVSKEDSLSQFLLMLGVVFIGVSLMAFNRDMGDPLGWRWILFITAVLSMVGAYWQRAVGLLIIGIIGSISWFSSVLYLWSDARDIASIATLVALALLAILFFTGGRLHEALVGMKRFALVYTGLGLLFITGILFAMSTRFGINLLQQAARGTTFSASWELTTTLFVLVVAIVGTTFADLGKKLFRPWEVVAVVVLVILFGSSLLISPGTNLFTGVYVAGSSGLTGAGATWAIIYNLAIFIELLALIFAGYSRKEPWMVNLGSLGIFALIIVKYFSWFFSFLDKSIFFIGAGILLFALGWGMEKGRRFTLNSMKVQAPSQLPQ